MISYLHGTILAKGPSHIVVGVHDIGYKVFTTEDTIEGLSLSLPETLKEKGADAQITLWTHSAIRENAHDLYGFLDQETLEFFELLITVSGIGPKTALSILNLAPLRVLKSAVRTGDASHMVTVSGIGRKSAEKIVLELKGKVGLGGSADDTTPSEAQDAEDALEALKELGYPERSAREALKKLDRSVVGTGEKVKQALKLLGK